MGSFGSEWDVAEMLLAGPGQTQEEEKKRKEKKKMMKPGRDIGEDRRKTPSAVTLAH